MEVAGLGKCSYLVGKRKVYNVLQLPINSPTATGAAVARIPSRKLS